MDEKDVVYIYIYNGILFIHKKGQYPVIFFYNMDEPWADYAKGDKSDIHVCMLSHVRLIATLWTIARQIPQSMGFSRQEYWTGLPCLPPGDLPDPGIEPESLTSPVLADRFFTTEPSGKPIDNNIVL